MLHFVETTASKKTKKAKTEDNIKIAIGDNVSLFNEGTICSIEKIRMLDTGKMVSKFKGDKNEIVVSLKGHNFTQNIWLGQLDYNK